MKTFLTSLLCVLCFMFYVSSVQALTFDLIAPSGQLVRGQDVKFTVNINTEGKALSSSSIGMAYETQYLEYVSAVAGNTFTTISTDVQNSGKLILTGSSTTSYSGSGVFAYVTYKIIATGSGSTQLCTLFDPSSSTPTPRPTLPPVVPTSLPKSGETNSTTRGIILATVLFITAAGGFIALKKT
ncbi:MAG: cohesin domain-containing protein [Patescibacteria group bacterium]|mgnify:CR=1 FL=1